MGKIKNGEKADVPMQTYVTPSDYVRYIKLMEQEGYSSVAEFLRAALEEKAEKLEKK